MHRRHAGADRQLSFRTADLDTAHAQVAETFAGHDVHVPNSRELDFRLDLAPAPRLTIGRMSYGAAATLTGPPMRLCYHVNLPVTGESTVEQSGVRRSFVAGEAGVAFGPQAPVLVQWSADSWQYHIKLPKDPLEAHAAKLAGRPIGEEIRFDLTFDLTSSAGQALVATAGFLYAELSRPDGISTIPAACHELESALMTQLLMTVPSQLTPELHGKPAHTRRSKIREIVDYVDRHPEDEITTADLATMAGVSERALQAGFREVVGMSPTAYLRGVRLDRVHRELICGAPGSVTDVAARWGFFHPGRFAQQYRARFGFLPSETVQRARR
ncbi:MULTISPECIES: AraC family transcriptional regulator [Rhodococcus]|uniref:AraC family transcriptional regulator n=1 Tax=Rhodococcus TaxID=1827 RepID=UPI0022861E7A|nr:AraC family transcriptional regulator [Rhodococcus sp. JS3073]WAM12284.1 AraC family transcriptional regulator [Rhodococcus sp. JS3073]